MKTRIKEFREKLGFSQEKLATLVDVTRQTIIALEQGRYNPSLLLAIRISRALNKKVVEEVFLV